MFTRQYMRSLHLRFRCSLLHLLIPEQGFHPGSQDEKVFYFAVQQQTLRLLDISEQQFESVTQHMLDLHVNNK